MLALSLIAHAAACLSAPRQLRKYVVLGARALRHAGRVAVEAIRGDTAARRCFVYTEVVLRRGSLLRIEHARGLSVVIGEGRLWLTQDHQARDAEIGAGAQVRLDGDGMALASTDRDTWVTLCGEVSDRMPWRITQVLRCGLRREVAARDRDDEVLQYPTVQHPMLQYPSPAAARFAEC